MCAKNPLVIEHKTRGVSVTLKEMMILHTRSPSKDCLKHLSFVCFSEQKRESVILRYSMVYSFFVINKNIFIHYLHVEIVC